MTNTAKEMTVARAYRAGYRSTAYDVQDARVKFVEKYCPHGPWAKDCDLCTAWFNGFEDQANQARRQHAKRCSNGLADRKNHEACDGAGEQW
jgi:hypothetical protein